MVSANLNQLELHTGTVEGDPEVEAHFAIAPSWATGVASTAVLCLELEPGKSGTRHVDMPEEILLVEQGEVDGTRRCANQLVFEGPTFGLSRRSPKNLII